MSLRLNKKLIKILGLNLSLMLLILCGLVNLFFEFVLPNITKHGQSITVPDLKGIHIDELQPILAARKLQYQITEDVMYLPQYPPHVVLQQYPKPGEHVKEGRRIYITLNATHAPDVLMPNLVDGSVRNAHIILKSRGLAYNSITYVVDIAKNAVLEQKYKGQPIAPGTRIPQGSKIDLVVGAGPQKHAVTVPDIVGMSLEEAELLLLDSGVYVGKVIYEPADTLQNNTILRQQPYANIQVNLGTPIQIWVSEAPTEGVISATEQPIIDSSFMTP